MKPEQTLLQGKEYTPAVATDVRKTFARFCPMWAERMKHEIMPLPIATISTHYKPRG